jgi:tetratricopeptide (TPR) repeat protein
LAEEVARQEFAAKLVRLLGYLDRDPNNVSLLADAAETALRAGDAEQAKALIGRGLAAAGKDQDARFRFGNLLLAAQEYAGAHRLFAEMADSLPHPAIYYNLAYAQVGESLFEDAVASLQKIPEGQRAELPQYDFLFGKALYYGQQAEAAVEYLNRYLKSVPEDREALGVTAMAMLDAGQMVAAKALANRLLGLAPDDAMGHMTLGSLAVLEKDPATARPHLEFVVKQYPDFGRAWSALGFTDLQEIKLEQAREHFRIAVQSMPNHLGTWHGLAWAAFLLGDMQAAHSAVASAMDLDRTFSENHGTLAVLLILEGRLDEAEQSIKRGLRLNPQSAATLYARGLLLAQRGDPESGKKLIERIYTTAGMKEEAAKIAEALIGFRPKPSTPQGGTSGNRGPKGSARKPRKH